MGKPYAISVRIKRAANLPNRFRHAVRCSYRFLGETTDTLTTEVNNTAVSTRTNTVLSPYPYGFPLTPFANRIPSSTTCV